jgi:hypothetical protein
VPTSTSWRWCLDAECPAHREDFDDGSSEWDDTVCNDATYSPSEFYNTYDWNVTKADLDAQRSAGDSIQQSAIAIDHMERALFALAAFSRLALATSQAEQQSVAALGRVRWTCAVVYLCCLCCRVTCAFVCAGAKLLRGCGLGQRDHTVRTRSRWSRCTAFSPCCHRRLPYDRALG